jgi:hypothetical protein
MGHLLAVGSLAFALASLGLPSEARAQELPPCADREGPRAALGEGVQTDDCVLLGDRALAIGVVEREETWSVRLAVLRDGHVQARIEVPLATLHPERRTPEQMDSAQLGIVRAGSLVRIGIGMAHGEDSRTIEELAWLIDLDGDRVRSHWSGIGSRASYQHEHCALTDMASIAIANGRARLRFTRERRFVPDPEWSAEERRSWSASCRFQRARRPERSYRLRPRVLEPIAEWPDH